MNHCFRKHGFPIDSLSMHWLKSLTIHELMFANIIELSNFLAKLYLSKN